MIRFFDKSNITFVSMKTFLLLLMVLSMTSCSKSFFRFSGDGRIDYIQAGKDQPSSDISSNIPPLMGDFHSPKTANKNEK